MEQNNAFDFDALAALPADERAAALSEYEAAIREGARTTAAAEYEAALGKERYENAKYRLSLDSSLPNFGKRIAEIEQIIASNGALASLGDEERLRTAYYIDRGKNAAVPTGEELLALAQSSPEVMRSLEAALVAKLSVPSPALSATLGGASMPITPKAKPKNLSEASLLAREALGL